MKERNRIQNTIDGTMLAGMALLTNQISQIYSVGIWSNFQLIAVLTGLISSGMILDIWLGESKYTKLFRMCSLENRDGLLPKVIKETVGDNDTRTLVIHIPDGLSQKHFEQKQQELEQSLNAKIEFSYNKNLIMKLIKMNLKSMYSFVFHECERPLQFIAGETYTGKFMLDIEKMPHAIIAGETGSGKSSLLDIICLSLILNKYDVHLHLIDFQTVTLGKYEDCKKVKSYGENPEDLDKIMDELYHESDRRLKLYRSVKDKIYIDKLRTWNEEFPERAMPPIVLIIDEFTSLKGHDDIFQKFNVFTSKVRKAGIYVLIGMQRPDVSMIDGSIKANMPCRIAFKTVTEVDSRVILDLPGAEKLDTEGRFLTKYCGKLQEIQALYIDPKHIMNILKENQAFKTKEEKKAEKKEKMEILRSKCINPYLKKGEKNDNKT